jgi:3-deoxy-D-manno-octulosonic-acid transferase
MAASLGLKLYNLGQRREAGQGPDRPARPPGDLVWLHAPGPGDVSPMLALARRLADEDGIAVVLTSPDPPGPREGVLIDQPPGDSPAEVTRFLDHWRPAVAVFSGGELRPAALHEADNRGIPLFLVNGTAPHFLRDRGSWYPGLMRQALARFAHVGALDEAAARAFRKAGASLAAVAVTGRLEEESAALPCLEADRAALARLLAARPVWFAAGLPRAEEGAVIQAHRAVLQQAHRLLLVVLPEDPAEAPALAARLESAAGWITACRAADAEPEPEVEAYVIDNPSEYGLWYRLAPVTFLGGSLAGPGPLRNPLEPAALGSAILHGRQVGAHAGVLGRLGAARAARAVASPGDLAEALGDLLAPDRAARMAQAAWAVTSDGAEVTGRLMDRIRQALEPAR